MEVYFVLDERGEPFPETDIEAWLRWFEQADLGVARSVISPEVTVLTTFRGMDDVPERGEEPRLFETRVFGGLLDGEEVHHATRGAALAGHELLAEWCRVGNLPDLGLREEDLR
jgi:hypothetical protein